MKVVETVTATTMGTLTKSTPDFLISQALEID